MSILVMTSRRYFGYEGTGDWTALSRPSRTPQDHHVVRQHLQPKVRLPRAAGSATQRRAEVALDHAVDALDLPALGIAAPPPAALGAQQVAAGHVPPPARRRRAFRLP